MSLISHGGDEVTGVTIINSDQKTKCLILNELDINLKIHKKSAARLLSAVKNKKSKENQSDEKKEAIFSLTTLSRN